MRKVGIIGCGNISHIHAKAYQSIVGVDLVACSDVDENKGKKFSKKYHCEYYKQYERLLRDPTIEVVSICTPHHLHKEMILQCINYKKHILCEKPVLLSTNETRDILEKINESKSKIAVCFQNRFNETTLFVKKFMKEEKLGALKGVRSEVTWHRSKEYYLNSPWRGKLDTEGGGLLINQAIHSIDLVCWLTKYPTKIKGKVMTTLLDEVIEVEDTAIAVAKLEEDVPFILYATNSYSSDLPCSTVFDFEMGKLSFTADEVCFNNQAVFSASGKTNSNGKIYWGNGHLPMIQYFIDYIDGEKRQGNLALLTDGIRSLEIIESIYSSNKHDCWVNL